MTIQAYRRDLLTSLCLAASLSLAAASWSRADNWPQFRGPAGAGISAEKEFPGEWGDAKNLKWKTVLPGPGSSSPITWGERVFVTCYSGYGVEGGAADPMQLKRNLLCLDRKDGRILWQQAVEAAAMDDRYNGMISEHGYASNTPATDGQRIYAFFGKTGVVAFDMEGKKLWQTSVGTQSGNRHWGSAASPILYKDLVIVNAADEGRALYALDKATGKVAWKAPGARLELTYATPVLAATEGDRQELLLAVPGEIWGMNPDTGKLVWYAQSPLTGNICPTIVTDTDNLYACGGYPRNGSVAMKRKGKGDVSKTNLLWSGPGPYIPSPVLFDGHLYWVDDKGGACCLEAATGKLVFRQDLKITGGRGSICYAGTVMANGRLYSTTRKGGTVIWAANPEFQEFARNKFDSDTTDFNASATLSGGAIFLRSNQALYCIENAVAATPKP
jgi:outer membrane protein assembly factor BamB